MVESWQTRSKCGSLSPSQAEELFFVGRGGKINKARDYCMGTANSPACPVREECLESALRKPGLKGFWAGTDTEDRKAMRQWVAIPNTDTESEDLDAAIIAERLAKGQPLEDALFKRDTIDDLLEPDPTELPDEEEVADLFRSA